MYKGKTYTIITDYKPSQKEAMQLMAAELDRVQTKKVYMTFETAALEYMEIKGNVLSPSTIKAYMSCLRNVSESFKALRVSQIGQEDVQKEINKYSVGRSPKTVRNQHGFISAVLDMYRPDLTLKTTLPQKIKHNDYIPTSEDVKSVLNALKGSKYEVAILLAAYGLRRSEIVALEVSDVCDGIVTVNKAKVQDVNGEWQIKTNKTYDSTRIVPIPEYLSNLIERQGYIYKGHPELILRKLHEVQDELGIPRFKLHTLRHFFATELSQAGFSEEDICALGGWSDSAYVMKRVYRHSRIDRDKMIQHKACQTLANSIIEE